MTIQLQTCVILDKSQSIYSRQPVVDLRWEAYSLNCAIYTTIPTPDVPLEDVGSLRLRIFDAPS